MKKTLAECVQDDLGRVVVDLTHLKAHVPVMPDAAVLSDIIALSTRLLKIARALSIVQ